MYHHHQCPFTCYPIPCDHCAFLARKDAFRPLIPPLLPLQVPRSFSYYDNPITPALRIKEHFERATTSIMRHGDERRVHFEEPKYQRDRRKGGEYEKDEKRRERVRVDSGAGRGLQHVPTIYILTFATDVVPRRRIDKLLDEQLPQRSFSPNPNNSPCNSLRSSPSHFVAGMLMTSYRFPTHPTSLHHRRPRLHSTLTIILR